MVRGSRQRLAAVPPLAALCIILAASAGTSSASSASGGRGHRSLSSDVCPGFTGRPNALIYQAGDKPPYLPEIGNTLPLAEQVDVTNDNTDLVEVSGWAAIHTHIARLSVCTHCGGLRWVWGT